MMYLKDVAVRLRLKWLVVLALSSSLDFDVSATPSASEILGRAEKVMKESSFKAHIIEDKREHVVFQKVAADGAVLSRDEVSVPVIRITIINPSGRYDIFPDQRTVVDHASLNVKKPTSIIARALPPRNASLFAETMIGVTNFGNEPCFILESRMGDEVAAVALEKVNAEAAKFLAQKYRYFVNTNTYHILLIEKYSQANTNKVEFKGIEPLPAVLPDDFFQPPVDFYVKKTTTSSEHGKVIGELSRRAVEAVSNPVPPAPATNIYLEKFKEQARKQALEDGLRIAKETGSKLTLSNLTNDATNRVEASPFQKK